MAWLKARKPGSEKNNYINLPNTSLFLLVVRLYYVQHRQIVVLGLFHNLKCLLNPLFLSTLRQFTDFKVGYSFSKTFKKSNLLSVTFKNNFVRNCTSNTFSLFYLHVIDLNLINSKNNLKNLQITQSSLLYPAVHLLKHFAQKTWAKLDI